MVSQIFHLLKKILTITALATAAFAAYEYFGIRMMGYPREMQLMDKHYRIVAINLEGRNATHLHATRRDNGRFFNYKIKDLHPINQWRMHLYPDGYKISQTQVNSNSNSHAKQTLAARDRLIEATEKLYAKIEAAESDNKRRQFEQEVARNLQKINTLEASLTRWNADYRAYENPHNKSSLLKRLTGILDRIANRDDPTAE